MDSGTYILVGAHGDSLWAKDQLNRHPDIDRWWLVDDESMEVETHSEEPFTSQ